MDQDLPGIDLDFDVRRALGPFVVPIVEEGIQFQIQPGFGLPLPSP
jgi:hypothetical protein